MYLSSLYHLPDNIDVVNKAVSYIGYNEGLLKDISMQYVIDNYTIDSLCFTEMISQIKSAKSVAVYGARNAAVMLSEYSGNELNMSIDSFAVSNTSAHVTQIYDIPVRNIEKYLISECNNAIFIVTTIYG